MCQSISSNALQKVRKTDTSSPGTGTPFLRWRNSLKSGLNEFRFPLCTSCSHQMLRKRSVKPTLPPRHGNAASPAPEHTVKSTRRASFSTVHQSFSSSALQKVHKTDIFSEHPGQAKERVDGKSGCAKSPDSYARDGKGDRMKGNSPAPFEQRVPRLSAFVSVDSTKRHLQPRGES